MNIFWLDSDIQKCVKFHNNKHCVKMILEYAQLLSAAQWLTGRKAKYRLTHKGHPLTKWVMQSKANYKLLCKLALALCKEYTFRYGKIHKTQKVIQKLTERIPDLPHKGFTNPPLCMPERYHSKNYIKSYRLYYIRKKRHIAKWKNRPIPRWYK